VLLLTACSSSPTAPRLPTLGDDPEVSFGVGLVSVQARFGINGYGCITAGDAVLVGRPGSHVEADARTFTLAHVGTFHVGDPVPYELGGNFYDHAIDVAGYVDMPTCGPGPYEVVTEN
jgi:hypothetical protein